MIEKLISKIAKSLDKIRVPYMIIGGQAVLLYGTPRLTRDIDITLGIDVDSFPVIEKMCKGLKLKILTKNPEDFVQETKVLPAEEPGLKIRIDFIFSFTPYERQAVKRAKKVVVSGYAVKFASCEDIIIHKMFAGRAIDLEDIKNILIKNKSKIDFKYTKKWLLEFSRLPEQKNILTSFNKLLKQI